MSHHVPRNDPPSLWDRVLSSSDMAIMTLISILAGIFVLLSVWPGLPVSRALAELPGLVSVMIVFMWLGTATLTGKAFFFPCKEWLPLRLIRLQFAGTLGLGVSWFAFLVTLVASANAFATITILMAGGLCAICGLRAVALWYKWGYIKLQKSIIKGSTIDEVND